MAYGPLHAGPGGRSMNVALVRLENGAAIMRIEGIDNREDAAGLRGTRLCVARAALPPAGEGAFYHHDLIGLRAELDDGSVLGTIAAVHDFGAGDVLEIRKHAGGTLEVAFSRAYVPTVDLSGGRVVIDRAALGENGP
jgi:16S rRNA processing protein RimM